MCGRYLLDVPGSTLAAMFSAENNAGEIQPRYNAAPGDALPIVIQGDGRRSLELASWGLPPGPGRPSLLINARGETAARKPTFAEALQRSRIVVPASGFYEWTVEELAPGTDDGIATDEGDLQLFEPPPPVVQAKPKTVKQPWCFRPVEGIFAFAGLRFDLPDPEGVARSAYIVLTCAPNETVASMHDRMPAILRADEAVEAWLDPGSDVGTAAALLQSFPDEQMRGWRVSRDVNSVRNDSPELVAPV
jgi:putative SOS response-associated peptidase YedK